MEAVARSSNRGRCDDFCRAAIESLVASVCKNEDYIKSQCAGLTIGPQLMQDT